MPHSRHTPAPAPVAITMEAAPVRRQLMGWLGFLLIALPLSLSAQSAQQTDQPKAQPLESWEAIIRAAPYWSSQGVFDNFLSIRQWVLFGTGYCQNPERHLLFDHQGRFIAYVSDRDSRQGTQEKLNATRARLVREERVGAWVPGDSDTRGYPFALACDQPHVDMDRALERYLGKYEEGRIWGAWDTLRVGTKSEPVSLHRAFREVYDKRTAEGRIDLPETVLLTLAGQLLIESGGRRRAHSSANARGILQLSPSALDDCQIPEHLHWHRLAQMDCALRLTQQNYRNLLPVFTARFGHLREDKKQTLLNLLLTQAYHGGVTRVIRLLEDERLGAPARYLAEQAERFSAGDIAFAMLFHNLDRDRIGFSSLYYGADVQLATAALQARLNQAD